MPEEIRRRKSGRYDGLLPRVQYETPRSFDQTISTNQRGLVNAEADGVKMAVVTSKKLPMAERGLACFDLGKFFSGIIGFDECSKHKPDPEPMLKGAELLGLAPEQCICVGDSPYDLQSGRTAGCMTAAVKWTYFNWEQMLALASPDFILQTLPDLVGIVKNLNQKGGKAYEKHRNYRGNRNI